MKAPDSGGALCLGVVQAGDWQFCVVATGESDLAIELEAAGKIVSGIRTLPGWQPPESRSFVWPPLPGVLTPLPMRPALERFIDQVKTQHAAYQVMVGSPEAWQAVDGWCEATRLLRVEGDGLSWVLSDPVRKRQFWDSLQALCR